MISTIIGKIKNLSKLFIAIVIVPTFLAMLYFGLFASDVYISESQFVVRSPDKPSSTGLGILLKSAGFTNAGDEIFATQAYAASRDALADLNKNGLVSRAYSRDDISIFDRFDPFGVDHSFESLFKYYVGKVLVEHETTSSITTMTVRAYSARDAYDINKLLLERSEAMVNRLNQRGRADLIQYANTEVGNAKKRSEVASVALADFRSREGVVDPEKQAAVQLQMISKIQDELITTRAELSQFLHFTPQNPQIPVLQARIGSLQHEIDKELGKVVGDRKSLTASAGQYQRLLLESQFADKQLASAMASLEEANNEARRKQAYVERVVQPNYPDEPLEPRRMRGVLGTFALGLVLWGILKMLFAGIKEHGE
ncbi:hypothetical protein [Sphingobium phenoxybenzoativorans]|uniref:hypothetical protein n=1 Tax=Sphingobium phenoxybenzoativorans TaxID=1592790 RepID=UPI0008729747|nr:hypothetical protein [Sphingobium phenoxybenzoativorans]